VREELSGAYAQLAGAFPALLAACDIQDSGIWAPWATSSSGDAALPPKVAAKLSPFQALLLVKTFRPDRWVSDSNC
jgi:hypothetical protein